MSSKETPKMGTLIIVAEELSTNHDEVEIEVCVKNLKTRWLTW